MKQIIVLLLVAFISCNDSGKEATKSDSQTDTTQTNTGSDVDDNVTGGANDKQSFVIACVVDAEMGQGLDAGRKKIFCDCLWEKSKGDPKLKDSETKGCMEKVEKMGPNQ